MLVVLGLLVHGLTSGSTGSRMVDAACCCLQIVGHLPLGKCHFLLVVSLPLSLQVLVKSYLQSASFGQTVTLQCISCFLCPCPVGASFLVSPRFVLYCYLVTVHYFPYSGCMTIVFASSGSGWSWGLFTCSGDSVVFSETDLVRWSSAPATLIAVPVLEWWQVPLVPLADLPVPGMGPDQEVCTLEEVLCNLFWLCLVGTTYMFI